MWLIFAIHKHGMEICSHLYITEHISLVWNVPVIPKELCYDKFSNSLLCEQHL